MAIRVEWFDFENESTRDGVLVSVSHAAHNNEHSHTAYVITKCALNDNVSYGVKVGDTVILPVKLRCIKVKGLDIPLFDSIRKS